MGLSPGTLDPARSGVSRRAFLAALGLGGVGVAMAACAAENAITTAVQASDRIGYADPEVAAAEAARFSSGRAVDVTVTAALAAFGLAGRQVSARSYGDGPVGPEIRASLGDELRVHHVNALDEETVIHWHGIQIRNDMDGAPPLTGENVAPGGSYDYAFRLPHAGTYWYHSHSGLQADEAMLGALIVEDPKDPYGADVDLVVVLDDWTVGHGPSPEDLLRALNPALGGHAGHGGHGGHQGHGSVTTTTTTPVDPEAMARTAGPHPESVELGGMTQHISYPVHLINGRPTADAEPLVAPPGATARLRIINAAAETPYRVAVGGRMMRVIETDGFPCEPVDAASVLVGMAQRVDVLVEVGSGTWPVVARVEGTDDFVATTLRSRDSVTSVDLARSGRIPELDRTPVQDSGLRATEASALPARSPDRTFRLELIQSPSDYVWGIAGPDVGKVTMRTGERIRVEMTNNTTMWHPMHLHGHTFGVPEYGGLRRDTVIIHPGQNLAFEFDADNPGAWMFHCHNAYHLDAGMTTNFYYER
ncbi:MULTISPECIES: multicopper oxidase family protein [unclassified Dietzia]|uniref:multicopper oxidase family protein n=1 Tax=unclassified Dietzia TaxID=2617939 RepID=UPI0015F905FB|nr:MULTISPECIES: multicopper oxidase family protein [unclassified Dietzia]MBB1023848.1 multicopper oxidase family protein [Dietzia sp. DQ12-76]MBB1027228.1 multicopper oxidase family protein [Dietzia sp. DQ11-38-2]